MNPAILEKVLMKLKAAGSEGMELGRKGLGAAAEGIGKATNKLDLKTSGLMAQGADKIKADKLAALIRKYPSLAGTLGLGAGAAGAAGGLGAMLGDDDGDEEY